MLSSYKKIVLGLLICSPALAKIEDNSFLLEEAYNQEIGVYQFIQNYQTFGKSGRYKYSFQNEIPITNETQQFSYEFRYERAEDERHGAVNDPVINYRIQPYSKDGVMFADRFGLIIPLGRVEKDAGNGVWGLEFMHAGSIELNDSFQTHFNIGVNYLPHAKFEDTNNRKSITNLILGSSLVHHWKDNLNFLMEALYESEDQDDPQLSLSPGMRWSFDFEWNDTQMVHGISFPIEVLNDSTEKSVFFYFSMEPSFL